MLSLIFGALWFFFSFYFSLFWAREIACLLPKAYIWWVISGIALLPGFFMSSLFFSNLLHWKRKKYPTTSAPVTVLMCAHNEETRISQAIQSILQQHYSGPIDLLVVDNASSDQTKQEIQKWIPCSFPNRSIRTLYCPVLGKSHALNTGLAHITTKYFITVDADTCLEKNAVQKIMNHIVATQSSCVAGNLFVQNTTDSFFTKIQTYDYLLSIAAVKRYQGSYRSTLVAQGAFSAFQTQAVRKLGGWKNVMGEDIVLTYQLLQHGLSSTYEPAAVGYTQVPDTFFGLYNQRKRWARGMLEGLSLIPPWKQPSLFTKYFALVNCFVIDLDLSFLFGFIPAILLALSGFPLLVGILTLITLLVCVLLFYSMFLYQKKLNIPFKNSFFGFLAFLLCFQTIQSMAALHGYLTFFLHRKGEWK